jgi:ribulose-phosphate 3-epimerase
MTADFARLGEQVRDACAGGADRIHLDIMDGHFVPNISFGPLVAKSIRPHCAVPLEAHLMIENADRYLEPFVSGGVDSLILHVEVCPRLDETIRAVRAFGKRVGVTLNPRTPLSAVEPYLASVDLLLVMTVQPGFGGQEFMPDMVDKIRAAREMLERLNATAELEVDGGINLQTIAEAHRAGADVFVVGSAVYNQRASVGESIRQLNAAVGK